MTEYFVQIKYPRELQVMGLSSQPSASISNANSNTITFGWPSIGAGETYFARVKFSGIKTGTYSLIPSKISYKDGRTSYTGTCNTAQILIRIEPINLPDPPPPQNVHSLPGAGHIGINWSTQKYDPNVPNIIGYNVYRRNSSSGYINVASKVTPPYSDTNILEGETYYYVITSLNSAGKESLFSIETAETAPSLNIRTYSVFGGSASTAITSGAAVGDVNGDGKPDLIVARPHGYSGGGTKKNPLAFGNIAIFFGGNSSEEPDVILYDPETTGTFGYSLAVVDLNKDGYDDIIVGNPYHSPDISYPIAGTAHQAGKVSVYAGGPHISSLPVWTTNGSWARGYGGVYYLFVQERLGYSMAPAGDFNGDGYQDVVIGAPTGGNDRSGHLLILYGNPNLSNLHTIKINGPTAWTEMGTSVAGKGDINNDGYSDVLASAPSGTSPGTYIVYGKDNFMPLKMGKLEGKSDDVGLLDFNGDGYSDVVIGIKGQPAKLFYGPEFKSNPDILFKNIYSPPEVTAKLILTPGDVNGDGIEDLLLPGPVLYLGNPQGDNIADYWRAGFQYSLRGSGDLDRNGRQEAIVRDLSGLHVVPLTTDPHIVLHRPHNYSQTAIRNLRVDGEIDAVVQTLTVGGIVVPVQTDGSFSTDIPLIEGENIFEAIAILPDNKVTKRILNVSHIIPEPLSISIHSPVPYSIINSRAITVTGSVSDPSAQVIVNGTHAVLINSEFRAAEIPLQEGFNNITVEARDALGQTATESIVVEVLTKGTMTGSVVNSSTGTLLSDASISVIDPLETSTTMTDSSGLYTLSGINHGNILATFSAPGLVGKTYDGVLGAGEVKILHVELTPIPPLFFDIVSPRDGTTVNETPVEVIGNVSPGARVQVNKVPATVDSGTFAVPVSLTEGNNTISAMAEDDYGQVALESLNVTLIIKSTLSGIITDTGTGQPIFSAQVILTDSHGIIHTATSDIEGHYRITGIPKGAYNLAISKDDYGAYNSSGTLTPGEIVTINTSLSLQVPAINNVEVKDITGYSATISWTTNQPTNSLVEFGTTPAYGNVVAGPTLTFSHEAPLPGLLPGTNYHFQITSTNSHGLASSSTDIIFSTLSPPTISDITIADVTPGSAIITWTTDQPSDSFVEYGTTAAYGNTSGNSEMTTNHIVTLGGLAPGVTYHFRAKSTSTHLLPSYSADAIFTTPGPPKITAIIVGDLTGDSATISWITDQPADGLVEYGTTTAYGNNAGAPEMASSHSITLTGLAPQTPHHFRITATNVHGIGEISADQSFTTASPITITLLSPPDGALISRPDVMVRGTFSNLTGNETGITVNGRVAVVSRNEFFLNHLPLTEGTNTLSIAAADAQGYTANASAAVIVSAPGDYLRITANLESGIAPLKTVLRIDGSFSTDSHSLSYIGPETVDFSGCDSYDACVVQMTSEGTYTFTASATGPDGNSYQDTVTVTVLPKTVLDGLLKTRWEGMKSKLAEQDVEGALNYFIRNYRDIYRPAFIALIDHLPQIAADMSAIEMVYLKDQVAKYRIRRMQDIQGVQREITYYIYFCLGDDGLWKIQKF